MKRFLLVAVLFVLASSLAACARAQAPAGTIAPTQTPWVVTATAPAVAETKVMGTTTLPTEPTPALVTLPEAIETALITSPDSGGVGVLHAELSPQLKTAEQVRAFGRVLGWVSGGSKGEFVQGAQVALKNDFLLKTLPSGDIFEFECVHYHVVNDEVMARPVCDGALVRFGTTSVVPAGSIGTLWLTYPVMGNEKEEWAEGFLNEPCICSDGDCRDQ